MCSKYPWAVWKLWLKYWFLVSVPSMAFFGCQLSWALQTGFVTPQLEELGVSNSVIGYIWLAGPITGLIIQPIVGTLSDNMSDLQVKYWGGRRRPFIKIGCILLMIGLITFSNAKYIGQWFDNNDDNNNNNNELSKWIAIISFWFLDVSTNVLQAPLRALLSDIIPNKYQVIANGIFGFEHGFGGMIGYIMGYSLSYNKSLGGGISLLFACGAILVLIGSLLTLIFSKNEKKLNIKSLSLNEINIMYVKQSFDNNDNNNDNSDSIINNNNNNNNDSENLIQFNNNNHDNIISQGLRFETFDKNDINSMNEISQNFHSSNNSTVIHNKDRNRILISENINSITTSNNNNNNSNNSNNNEVSNESHSFVKEFIFEIIYCRVPAPIVRAFHVKFWDYFGMFTTTVYISDWFGKDILNGNPNGSETEIDNYDKGVIYANLGFSIMAFLSLFVSLLLPYFCNKYGFRIVYIICLFEYSIVLITLGFINGPNNIYLAILLISMMCLTFSAAQIVGWSIVTETISYSSLYDNRDNNGLNNKKGIYTTFFNMAACLPEILLGLCAASILKLFNNDVNCMLWVAGTAAFCGAIASCFIIEPRDWHMKKLEMRYNNGNDYFNSASGQNNGGNNNNDKSGFNDQKRMIY